eukprot:1616939-Amphidinium_carterae.1
MPSFSCWRSRFGWSGSFSGGTAFNLHAMQQNGIDLEDEEEVQNGSGTTRVAAHRAGESDEDAELDDELMQAACLPVSGPPLPPSSAPPQDADEYLRQ